MPDGLEPDWFAREADLGPGHSNELARARCFVRDRGAGLPSGLPTISVDPVRGPDHRRVNLANTAAPEHPPLVRVTVHAARQDGSAPQQRQARPRQWWLWLSLAAGVVIGAVLFVAGSCGRGAASVLVVPPSSTAFPIAGAVIEDSPGRYTGFIYAASTVSLDDDRVRLTTFRFRPTRVKHHVTDAHASAVSLECTYPRESFEAIRPLDSLVTFTADEPVLDQLRLTSCPEDAFERGNLDIGS
jgi:hypothetical protein